MAIGLVRSIERAFSAVFPERRIYVRTNETTRYLSLGARAQLSVAILALSLVGWTGFATSAYVKDVLDGHAAVNRLESLQQAYDARVAALAERQKTVEEQLNQANQRRDAVTARLSDKQEHLVATANKLHAAEAELAALRTAYSRAADQRRSDQAKIAKLDAELGSARLALAETKRSSANLADAFDTFSGTMSQVIAERDTARAKAHKLTGKVAELSDNYSRIKDHEQRLVAQVQQAASISLAGLEHLFSKTNIDIDKIMAKARRDYTGEGGPFEPVSDTSSGDSASADSSSGDMQVAALMKDLQTVDLMRFAAKRLPLGEPVNGARLTSGFGVRTDPLTHRRARHEGLDLAAPRGTPIYSTADGVVVFSGRERGYGNVVKIRHAFGFETVYAHLSRSRVKVGQRVKRGQRIADMGNTGRSTGSHLHYEVRIDNQPVNPLKFVKAPRDVL